VISIVVGVQMFIQLTNLKSRLLTMVIAAILSPELHGCTHLSQVESLDGKSRTETYRTWVREDQNAQRLLVFVHGFNSSKDLAWGKFPELIVRDSAFDGFNILLFGYPTKFCGEINDLRRLGEFLGSFLKDELPKYKSVQMVGHSMGGLVIQHALLSIESSRFTLLKETVIEVQAFGTPFYGVEGADSLRLLCENKQADDLTVLNKELGRLQKDWAQRFNRSQEQADDRVTMRIPLDSFYGLEDHFVREASACGGAPVNCDAVDGDHISMVKPESESHLAYRKVRGLAKELVRRSSQALPTAKLELPRQEGERAARLEEEFLALKAHLTPRHLTAAQRSHLIEVLSKGGKDKIGIMFLSGNTESYDFAKDFYEVLISSGWPIMNMIAIVPIGGPIPGLAVTARPPQEPLALVLRSAFESIGLTVSIKLNPKADPPLQLVVGGKPER
jgi:Putative serine esterase (DUF676)